MSTLDFTSDLNFVQMIEAKKRDSAAFPFFLHYNGDKPDEFWQQVEEFALQINFLSMFCN